ncbi:helix-turn-helix domain-containing protein [Occallatibacter riparius]|uniref:Helix-turn-helix transcriptional regulator n=1 Tax=Occallatibacter riparius TaxID=1002689 RepID=A0A9J7BW98_9BACT|nr:helix-turn-helix transcriptional regulator [Occallatibacter riparius]UWZ86785.1 helix-turn-helix transcriptional regulator [Occallatibacter riparius]
MNLGRRTDNVQPMLDGVHTVGKMVRSWRELRRFSQLDLALEAEVSQRHLSFIESGRATPSREMVLHLAERLEVPFRERNVMLLAAGYSPVYGDRRLEDPTLAHARTALELLLKAHEPYPALTVDRHWNIVGANAALGALLEGVAAELLKPPANALRISLHPRGLAPKIVNLVEWRHHLLERLRRQFRISRDPALNDLLNELSSYPAGSSEHASSVSDSVANDVALPLRLRTSRGVLSFLSTVTVFGTPVEITLSELSLEAFYPADQETARVLGIAR